MPAVELLIRNRSGLHARPAAAFVKVAAGHDADLRVANVSRDATREVDAKSLLAVMGLEVSRGDRIRLTARGAGAAAALRELRSVVESGLGEPVEAMERR